MWENRDRSEQFATMAGERREATIGGRESVSVPQGTTAKPASD